VSNDSLLSLTAHWLTDSFERKSAALHAQPMYQAHTREYICTQYKQMLVHWEIKAFTVQCPSDICREPLGTRRWHTLTYTQ